MTLVRDPQNIRLAMLGMVDGNGHPYSWSAIFNGFDPDAMASCPFPAIPEYLNAQPPEAFGIAGARVTHIWCEDPEAAKHVAEAARISNILERPEDAIGQVDAVVIPTDKGWEHVERARPFVDAGLPLFIDKPLVDRVEDLRQFAAWEKEGKAILSSSCMRYSKEFAALRSRLDPVDEMRLITMTTAKSWERYGIHALEGVYPFLPPGGWESAANTGTETSNVVHIRHESGVDVVLAAVSDMYGGFGYLNVHGTKGSYAAHFEDTFFAFKAQLTDFIRYLQTGERPFPFSETVELMKIVIAGILSREQDGARIDLRDLEVEEGQS